MGIDKRFLEPNVEIREMSQKEIMEYIQPDTSSMMWNDISNLNHFFEDFDMKINEFKLKVWGLAEYNFESQVGMNFQKMVKNRILICEKCCADRFTYSFGKICGNDGLLWYIKKSCIMEDVLYVIYCEPQKG